MFTNEINEVFPLNKTFHKKTSGSSGGFVFQLI